MAEEILGDFREGFIAAIRDNIISFLVYALLNKIIKNYYSNYNLIFDIFAFLSILFIIGLLEKFNRSSVIFTIGCV